MKVKITLTLEVGDEAAADCRDYFIYLYEESDPWGESPSYPEIKGVEAVVLDILDFYEGNWEIESSVVEELIGIHKNGKVALAEIREA